ncbi:MAG: hypothetical protein DWQ44_00420 [Bacteroidetes bacterium]|nr:MAG: hypothetical protein DWQ33_03795 [Bacteroidota bacterium]REK07590.1 MAG: hypothetical protein DWQ39_01475 [Bacteroidota bacterium]REK36978.1 MAG: hypothetical protein DWQ44_00420 [Bacteroidota bacterium]REK47798.1 MAG: hypothetical protein DWQ48_11480 [Bacteroidota bacterium]
MKRLSILSAALFISCTSLFAQGDSQKPEARQEIGNYFIKITHDKDQCLKSMNDLNIKPGLLARFQFACSSGDHSGYTFVPGKDENNIREMLPAGMNESAYIVKVSRVSPGELEKRNNEKSKDKEKGFEKDKPAKDKK